MLSYLDLLDIERPKYDRDIDAVGDPSKFILLCVIKQTITSMVVRDEIPDPSSIDNIASLANPSQWSDGVDFESCESDGWIKQAVDRCTFNVPLVQYPEFTKLLFALLAGVTFKLDKDKMGKNCVESEIDFPVSYLYFQKIIVGLRAGEWKFLDARGNVHKGLSHIVIDQYSKQELRKPTDGYYEKHRYYFNNGGSMIADRYVDKYEAIERHEKWLARITENIQSQKSRYKDSSEKMQAQGYPYTDSYDEYIRFLVTNQRNMKFGKYTLLINDLLQIFVPYPLR